MQYIITLNNIISLLTNKTKNYNIKLIGINIFYSEDNKVLFFKKYI